jgi:DNA-binding SARP family transcriptional activator
MPIAAHLLGPPLMVRDGVVYAPPKGKKVWGLFAYLVLSDRPPTRPQLIELLFPDAEDPAGALRWNLSELRRLLGGSDTVGSGNTVQLRLPEGSTIDVEVLMAGTSLEAVELPGLGRELLEGIEIDASPGFTAWLLGERRRLQALSEAVLREGALRALTSGDARRAVELATRLVAIDALNEDAHALLIRAFAGTGDEVAVQRQLAASIDLFRRELGVEPGTDLMRAATVETRAPASIPGGGAALQALVESGQAAVSAGAVRAGVETLRNAVATSRERGEPELEAIALLALGSALAHAASGYDEEGSTALHRCVSVAESIGARPIAAAAHRELGYVDLLRGDYLRAETWLRTAETLADRDPLELARIRGLAGVGLSDVGAHEQAAVTLDDAIGLAESVGSVKQQAWALTFRGRSNLLWNRLDDADRTLERAREMARTERWTAFMAFPEALSAEVWFRRGDLDRAADTFEHAYALGCQVGDACWESYGVRGFGLMRAARGDLAGAIESMEGALAGCARVGQTHLWLRAYIMDALCAIAVATRHPTAEAWVTDLASLASRSGMREFAVRSYRYRADLGDASALDAARVLAMGVENPHLHELIEPDAPSLLDDLLGKVAQA